MTTTTTKLSNSQKKQLNSYAEEIRGLVKSTLESAVRIGQILKDVRDNILPSGEWQKWVDDEFNGNIKHDSANNWINVADLYAEYSTQYEDGLSKLSLSSLYKLSRNTIDPKVKETVLQLAQNNEPLDRNEMDAVVRVYRKAKMVDAGIEPYLINELSELDIAENPKELTTLRNLSKRKREAVSKLIAAGAASDTKEAIKQLSLVAASKVEPQTQVEVAYTQIKEASYSDIYSVPSNSVNVCIIEAPLRYSYIDELNTLSVELERILMEGGFAIITLGHKALLFAGDRLEPLKALHVLCLRRSPGRTRSIIGTNIMSASVFAALAYKAPYRAPKEMIVDLQTIIEPDEDTPIEGTEEVVSGLEAGFKRFLHALTQPDDVVMHYIASDNHFNIREELLAESIELKASAFFTVN